MRIHKMWAILLWIVASILGFTALSLASHDLYAQSVITVILTAVTGYVATKITDQLINSNQLQTAEQEIKKYTE